jgi:heat-inducible transcriptional repressor
VPAACTPGQTFGSADGGRKTRYHGLVGSAALSTRQEQILYATVSEFVRTGEPVSSKLLQRCGVDLSPATIRAVLAELEAEGYLHQPHTSAGRVPTDRAFRLFIDALMQLQELSREEHALIRGRLRELEPGQEGLRETGKLLSEMTGAAALVVDYRPSPICRHLRFVRIGPNELLGVLVQNDGGVRNQFLVGNPSDEDIAKMHALLDDIVDGRSVSDLRDFFQRRRKREEPMDPVRKLAFELGEQCLTGELDERPRLVLEGTSRLLERSEFADLAQMKSVISALANEDALVRWASQATAASGPTVAIGSDDATLEKSSLAVVSAQYGAHAQGKGVVAVIGPTRMDYPKVVPIVTATANAMAVALNKSDSANKVERDD